MDFIIIILFIILIPTLMIMAYVPYSLHTLAKKAGFSKLSLRFLLLKLQKIPIKYLFEQYEKIVDNKIDIEFDELKRYWASKPENFESSLKIIINAGKKNIKIDLDVIEIYNLSENNSERFFSILKKTNYDELKLSQDKISGLVNSDTDIDKYFEIYESAKEIHNEDLFEQTKQNDLFEIELFIKNLIKAEKIGIKKDHKLLNDNKLSLKEKNLLLSDLILIKSTGLNISDDELSEIFKLGINLHNYIKSVEIIQTGKISNINKEKITDHYIKGGDALRVINALEYAQLNNTYIAPEDLFELDLNKTIDFESTVEHAIIPYDLEVNPAIYLILKDGLQVTPKLLVSVKKNVNTDTTSGDEKNLFYNINEKITDELQKFDSHTEVLKDLITISENVLKNLKKDQSEPYHNTFELLKIKIADIDINADKLAEVKEIQAKEKETKAKLDLIKSKKKFNEDMATALKEGKISFADYQKEKYIFNSDDENDLPYHSSDK